jgi:hypothetical protein
MTFSTQSDFGRAFNTSSKQPTNEPNISKEEITQMHTLPPQQTETKSNNQIEVPTSPTTSQNFPTPSSHLRNKYNPDRRTSTLRFKPLTVTSPKTALSPLLSPPHKTILPSPSLNAASNLNLNSNADSPNSRLPNPKENTTTTNNTNTNKNKNNLNTTTTTTNTPDNNVSFSDVDMETPQDENHFKSPRRGSMLGFAKLGGSFLMSAPRKVDSCRSMKSLGVLHRLGEKGGGNNVNNVKESQNDLATISTPTVAKVSDTGSGEKSASEVVTKWKRVDNEVMFL